MNTLPSEELIWYIQNISKTKEIKMKKKLVVLLMAATLAFSAVGCGSTELSNEYITVTQYEKLEVPKLPQMEVTDDMITQAMQSELFNNKIKTPVEGRAAENGDTVLMDYTGSVDGVEFEGGTATDAPLVLGSGTFIGATANYQGFEEQLVGHNIGDEFDITVQFPEEYHEPSLKGVPADFHIVIKDIYTEEMPELNDEFVASVSEKSKTVDEYKEEIRAKIEEETKLQAESQLAYVVLDSLAEKTEVKSLPQDELDERIAKADEYYRGMAQSTQMEFADFCTQYLNMSEEDYTKTIKEIAESELKKEYACNLVAKKKGLMPSDKEFEKRIEEFAIETGFTDTDEFIKMVGEDTIKNAIVQDEVGKYLAKTCVQVEMDIPAEGAR